MYPMLYTMVVQNYRKKKGLQSNRLTASLFIFK